MPLKKMPLQVTRRPHPPGLQSFLQNRSDAKAIAKQGKGGDTEVAHLTPGEKIVPPQAQTPALNAQIDDNLNDAGLDSSAFTSGSPLSKVNSKTGVPEYSGDPAATASDPTLGGVGGTATSPTGVVGGAAAQTPDANATASAGVDPLHPANWVTSVDDQNFYGTTPHGASFTLPKSQIAAVKAANPGNTNAMWASLGNHIYNSYAGQGAQAPSSPQPPAQGDQSGASFNQLRSNDRGAEAPQTAQHPEDTARALLNSHIQQYGSNGIAPHVLSALTPSTPSQGTPGGVTPGAPGSFQPPAVPPTTPAVGSPVPTPTPAPAQSAAPADPTKGAPIPGSTPNANYAGGQQGISTQPPAATPTTVFPGTPDTPAATVTPNTAPFAGITGNVNQALDSMNAFRATRSNGALGPTNANLRYAAPATAPATPSTAPTNYTAPAPVDPNDPYLQYLEHGSTGGGGVGSNYAQ